MTIVKDDLHGFLQTRRSLEAQTSHDWEHVVVPASAGDSTALLIREAQRPGLVLRVQDGQGIYSAMNQGLAATTQDFVLFLNAGDLLAGAETLAVVSAELTNSPASWFVFGGVVVATEQETLVNPVPHPNPWSVGCGRANMMHPSIYYRRDFLLALGGFDESFTIAGDLELNMRAVARAVPKVTALSTSVFFADGISSTRVFSSLREALRARQVLLDEGPVTATLSHAVYLYQVIRAAGAKLRRSISRVFAESK